MLMNNIDLSGGVERSVFCVFIMKEGGKLAVLGSCHMFSDQYLDKEENSKIMVSTVVI